MGTIPPRVLSTACGWLVGSTLGKVATSDGHALDVEISLEAGPSALYDALVVPNGADAVDAWLRDANALDFVREQYRHCKPILVVGEDGKRFLEKAKVPTTLPTGESDPSIVGLRGEAIEKILQAFKTALSTHRAYARETDPPQV